MTENTKKPITIYANGQCVSPVSSIRQLAEIDAVDTLQIMIDGNRLLSGTTTTLLGEGHAYLCESRKFRLTHFAPQPNGLCLLHYAREQKKQG